ncbi:hypothetical protein GCM10027413_11950 [Conyzicola nivalis]|uniref:PH domain-containing protein n=1 Tax=Conyzicola nivalis TaxID=1477021 RepID=A0A916SHZ4_9MICO|nr:hypothetical protein [Conyzicola nivalis]GGB01199.1 hypothetical protein GCM10010979_14680 [Conyzicola nivalis]
MQTVTPSRAHYRKSVLVGCGLAALLVVVILARMRGGMLTAGVVVIAVAFVLTLIGIWLYFRNTKVQYGDGLIVTTDLFGRSRQLTTATVTQVVLVEHLRGATQLPAPVLFLLGDNGRALLRLRAGLWTIDDLGAIGAAIPRDPDVVTGLITSADLRKRFPAAVSFWEAHAVVASLAVAAVVIAAAAVLPFIFASGR